MDMPTPDAHVRLHRLAGQWGGEETLHAALHDSAGGSATAFINTRIALDGLVVVQEYEQYRHGRPTFSGLGVFWFDVATSQYVMTWLDSTVGAPSDFRGDFDGDVLQLVHARPHGGFARCTFDTGLPDEYVFMMEVSNDGEHWTPAMEGAYGLLTGPARGVPATSARTTRKPAAANRGPAATRARKSAAKTPASSKTSARNAATRKGATATGVARKGAAGKGAAMKGAGRKGAARKAPASKGASTKGAPRTSRVRTSTNRTAVKTRRARPATRPAGRGKK